MIADNNVISGFMDLWCLMPLSKIFQLCRGGMLQVQPVECMPTFLFFPKQLSLPPVFCGVCVTRSLVLCTVCFVDHCSSLCPFSFGHCVVCSSSVYGFCLPLWYLQTLLEASFFFKLLGFRWEIIPNYFIPLWIQIDGWTSTNSLLVYLTINTLSVLNFILKAPCDWSKGWYVISVLKSHQSMKRTVIQQGPLPGTISEPHED